MMIFFEELIKCLPYEILSNTNQNQTVLDRLQDNCYCDLTQGSCDNYCCCDPDCKSSTLLTYWTTYNLCFSPTLSSFEKYLKFCYKNSQALVTDMESPLNSLWRIFRSGFCLISGSLDKIGYSDGVTSNINNITEFNSLVTQYKKYENKSDVIYNSFPSSFYYTNPKLYIKNILPSFLETINSYSNLTSDINKLNFYINNINNTNFNWTNPVYNDSANVSNIKLSNFTNEQIFSVAGKLNISIFQGYKPQDPIAGYYQINNTLFYNYTTLNFPNVNTNGACLKNTSMIKFMQNLNLICSNKLIMDKSNCENYNKNNIFHLENLNLFAGINSEDKSLKNIKQTIKYKKVFSRFNTIDQNFPNYSSLINFTSSNTSTTCGCRNLVTEINYNFYVNRTLITENEVIFFLEDFNDTCGTSKFIPVTYKIKFMSFNKTFNYTRSGNPGYNKAFPIVLGQTDSYQKFNNVTGLNDTLNYIRQYSGPRILFGISLNPSEKETAGQCLFSQNISATYNNSGIIEKPFYDINSINNATLNPNFTLYLDNFFDNQIKFYDKFSWGCMDRFSYIDLRKFCLNQDWKKKLIYQNLNNITHIGKFGNADRHFISDWVKIDKLDINQYISSWDDFYNRCSIPARINLNILYATYGMVNNTQIGIFRASLNIEYIYWWAKFPNSIDKIQNFNTYFNINFYRIPQSMVWWFAPPPGFIKLPRNIMYPFRIGTTLYNSLPNSAGFLKNDHFNFIKQFLVTNKLQLPQSNNIKFPFKSFMILAFLMSVILF